MPDSAPSRSVALPNWSQRLLSELDASDRRAQLVAKALTPVQLNWKLRPDTWSVGQCLEHLRATNEIYLPVIAASLKDRPRARADEIFPGWFGRWFIRNFIEPSSKTRRARAPRKIEPRKEVDPTVLETFLRSNRPVRELIQEASDYDVNRIRFKNPFIPMLRFTVGTGLEIISKHQSRHLLQAERIRQSADFPVA